MDDLRANAEILAGRIPPRSLAIAALEGGDALVMALDEQHYGRIYWWEHEIEENQISELTLLAQSFSELMEKLEPDTEEVDLDPDDVLGAWDGPDDPESREGEQ
jgi:thiamine pyrophosphate-dependent acetolactate synthase large subunit-like protein